VYHSLRPIKRCTCQAAQSAVSGLSCRRDTCRDTALRLYIEGVVHHLLTIFRLRQKSLVRAVLLSLGAFAASLRLAGFPHIENLHGSYWQILALLVAAWGMAETARCLQRKWSFYHAGVLLLLYADLMILAAIVVMLVAP
jgi:hypothetical protein